MWRSLVVLAVLINVGCHGFYNGNTVTPVWRQARNIDDIELWEQAVSRAIHTWSAALGPDCKFPYAIGPLKPGGYPITLIPRNRWIYGRHVGMTSSSGIEVLDSCCGPLVQHAVLVHELGHMFGLSHSLNKNSIMHFSVRIDQLPTRTDVVNARIALGCSPTTRRR